MYTSAFRNTCLAQLGGFLGLIKSITDARAGTVVEAAYSGYGTRPAITYSASADTSPAGGREVGNSAIINFPVNGGANEDQIAWGIWSAATAGTLHAIGMLDADPPIFGYGHPTGELVTAFAHGLETDQRVFVFAAPGALLPAGLAENTAYFVLAAGLTADAFALSTTSGGAAVNITAGGNAMFMPYKVRTVAGGATPSVAAGAVKVQQ